MGPDFRRGCKIMNTQDINRRIRLIMDLRTKGITDTKVLSAMERVPRDIFVPGTVRDQAWDDMALPIGRGQTISQPYIVAVMTQNLNLTDQDRVLEIGTGCGYQTAVLAGLARRVYTIERHKVLADMAQETLEDLKIRNVTAIAADGMNGWPKMGRPEAPEFDKIIVTACARGKPPQALLSQLKEGGIMVVPVEGGPDGDRGEQILKRYKKEGEDTYSIKDICTVRFVPLLPDMGEAGEGA